MGGVFLVGLGFFFQSAQSLTVMIIIPLLHIGNNFAIKLSVGKKCVGVPKRYYSLY